VEKYVWGKRSRAKGLSKSFPGGRIWGRERNELTGQNIFRQFERSDQGKRDKRLSKKKVYWATRK